MTPRLRSSSAPPSPGLLGPPPSKYLLPSSQDGPRSSLSMKSPKIPYLCSSASLTQSDFSSATHEVDSLDKMRLYPQDKNTPATSSLSRRNSTSCPPSGTRTPRNADLPPPTSDLADPKALGKATQPPQGSPPPAATPKSQQVARVSSPATNTQNWSEKLMANIRTLKPTGIPSLHATGIPLIQIPLESITDSADEWKEFVIGQFYGLPPTIGKIDGVINSVWSKNGPRIKIQNMGNGKFMFKMPNSSTKKLALSRKIWHVGPCPLYVSEYSPFHDPNKPPLTKISTWVSLRGVPHQLFNFDCLSRLITGIGIPIYLDKATSPKENLTVARIYTEVNVTAKLPRKLAVNLPSGDEIYIDVDYSWLPPRCQSCSEIGHVARYCPSSQKPTA
ncbi:PREDICTED: uncharacterized protein LOC104810140 [Tarenaya hassleriana]|uniref:uncharacterized protein LOC104810140 n=1 Tax=Tarenaya hassleriana TaxID=28532 RepID=UPI00053C12FD|nr:PREDICTED: uncharacterized protein LOC104810140 [Tarenaya hassleriana]